MKKRQREREVTEKLSNVPPFPEPVAAAGSLVLLRRVPGAVLRRRVRRRRRHVGRLLRRRVRGALGRSLLLVAHDDPRAQLNAGTRSWQDRNGCMVWTMNR